MKKSITTAMLLFSLASFSQMKVSDSDTIVTVGKYKAFGNFYAEISKSTSGYFLVYTDILSGITKSFYFSESDFEELYKLFSNIEAGKEKRIDLEGGDILMLTYNKGNVELFHIDKYGITGNMKAISPKQVDKLFGK